MTLDKQQVVSAQVLLRAASGKHVDGETRITAENVSDYAPSHETVSRATATFSSLGFDTGEMVGISFSITAPISKFEEVFQTSLAIGEQGGIVVAWDDGTETYELPLDSLSPTLQEFVTAVTFSPPPDFGPPAFFGP
jgi:hypothetical protein